MHYKSIFTLNPGKSRSLFLPEISVEGLALKDVANLKTKVYRDMKMALLRHQAEWIQVSDHQGTKE
jgi:1-acyl-sn-glycerol-3-phosphate acyltransferase